MWMRTREERLWTCFDAENFKTRHDYDRCWMSGSVDIAQKKLLHEWEAENDDNFNLFFATLSLIRLHSGNAEKLEFMQKRLSTAAPAGWVKNSMTIFLKMFRHSIPMIKWANGASSFSAWTSVLKFKWDRASAICDRKIGECVEFCHSREIQCIFFSFSFRSQRFLFFFN